MRPSLKAQSVAGTLLVCVPVPVKIWSALGPTSEVPSLLAVTMLAGVSILDAPPRLQIVRQIQS